MDKFCGDFPKITMHDVWVPMARQAFRNWRASQVEKIVASFASDWSIPAKDEGMDILKKGPFFIIFHFFNFESWVTQP